MLRSSNRIYRSCWNPSHAYEGESERRGAQQGKKRTGKGLTGINDA